MSDAFRRIERGEKSIPAALLNELVEIAREHRASRYRFGSGPLRGPVEDSVSVLVRNDTGVIVPQFGVLRPTAPVVLPSVSDPTWRERRVYAASAPTSTDAFVLTLESIAPEAIGSAIIAGVTPCFLSITDSGDEYAGPTTSIDKLATGTSGPARIIWKESATGSNVRAVVLLTGTADASATSGGGGSGVPVSGARVYSTTLRSGFYSDYFPFAAERWDTAGYHDNASNNTRLTIPADGYYMVGVNFGALASIGLVGAMTVRLMVNRSYAIANGAGDENDGITGPCVNLCTVWPLEAGDYVECLVSLDNCSVLAGDSTNGDICDFWIQRLN